MMLGAALANWRGLAECAEYNAFWRVWRCVSTVGLGLCAGALLSSGP